jgi:putative membrane protein
VASLPHFACYFYFLIRLFNWHKVFIGSTVEFLVIRKNIIMKKISFVLMSLPLVFACNNSSNDSVSKADSANEAKADTNTAYSDTTNKMSGGGTMAVEQSTADFMVKVADVGMTEVKLGGIAQDKGASQRVKDFGAMMTKDHTKAGDELQGLARQKNVTLPSTVGEDHQKKIDDLSKKTGKDFDKAYIDMMVDGHQSAVNDFERASKNTKDADVKAWVDKTLPTLKMHLDSARAIKKAIR